VLGGGSIQADNGHHHHDRGPDVSVSVHDGQVEIDGIREMVDQQLESALDSIDAKNLPPQLRDKLRQRLQKLRGTLDKRLRHLDVKDLDQLGAELGQMGEEIGREMEGLGSDMGQWGEQFGQQFGQQFSKKWTKKLQMNGRHGRIVVNNNDDSDDDLAGGPDVDDADADFDDVVRDLGDLQLQQPQRDAIAKLRADSERQIAQAKRSIETASQTLHDALESDTSTDIEIAREIDMISQQEATIRKARILSWVNARRVLDDAQRKRVEHAAKSKTR
jgi:hypothetical protein